MGKPILLHLTRTGRTTNP